MKTFIIGFSRPTKPTLFSTAIQWAEKTNYDHVYIKWHVDGIDRVLIYQASKLAVNFETQGNFDGHALTVEEYEVTTDDATWIQVLQFALDNSDKPYGLLTIVGDAYILLCSLLNQRVHNPFPSYASNWICSKIIYSILIIANIIKSEIPLDDVTPLMLNQMIQKVELKRVK